MFNFVKILLLIFKDILTEKFEMVMNKEYKNLFKQDSVMFKSNSPFVISWSGVRLSPPAPVLSRPFVA
jgi:hypothetical protein